MKTNLEIHWSMNGGDSHLIVDANDASRPIVAIVEAFAPVHSDEDDPEFFGKHYARLFKASPKLFAALDAICAAGIPMNDYLEKLMTEALREATGQ